MRVVTVVLVSFLCTMAVGTAAVVLLPGPFAEAMVPVLLGVPVFWGLAAFHAYWDARAWRPLAIQVLLTLGSLAVLVWSEPLT